LKITAAVSVKIDHGYDYLLISQLLEYMHSSDFKTSLFKIDILCSEWY